MSRSGVEYLQRTENRVLSSCYLSVYLSVCGKFIPFPYFLFGLPAALVFLFNRDLVI